MGARVFDGRNMQIVSMKQGRKMWDRTSVASKAQIPDISCLCKFMDCVILTCYYYHIRIPIKLCTYNVTQRADDIQIRCCEPGETNWLLSARAVTCLHPRPWFKFLTRLGGQYPGSVETVEE